MYESRLTACQLYNIICSISANFCNSFTIWARNSVYNTLEALAALVANIIEYLAEARTVHSRDDALFLCISMKMCMITFFFKVINHIYGFVLHESHMVLDITHL